MDSTDFQPERLPAPAGARSSSFVTWLARLKAWSQPAVRFWTKLNDDWVFSLSALLAYNFLMSMFPILLVLLAGLGFALGSQAPEALAQAQQAIERAVPGGGVVFVAVSDQLANSAGFLLVFGLGVAIFTGSRLFVVMENCFGVIFRVPSRPFVRQNLMAFAMLALYLVLVSAMILASALPVAILPLLDIVLDTSALQAAAFVLSTVAVALSALILFGAIYLVVPNRRIRLRQVWPGTLVAALMLVVFDLLFPIYVRMFLHPASYGAVASFAIVTLLFFYYLGFILLIGAELNAWIAGRRHLVGDIAGVMHQMRTKDNGSTQTHPPEASPYHSPLDSAGRDGDTTLPQATS